MLLPRLRGIDGADQTVGRRRQSFTSWVIEVAVHAKHSGYLRGLDAETVAVSLVGSVTTTAARWIELTPERPLSQQSAKVRAVFAELVASKGDA